MASFWSKMRAGLNAFREAYFSADLLEDGTDLARSFSSYEARALRYAVLWAIYENTAYRDIHHFATKLRADYGLYKHIRGLHNPAYRLIEFHTTHLLGGALDPAAGDGAKMTSAIPIANAQASLRKAIAQLWRDSNWQTRKDIWTRYGTTLGDTALLIVDDVARQKVYLQPCHPGTLTDVQFDPWGNVKGYTREELRPDPRPGARPDAPWVTYSETASRDGDDVVFLTRLNNQPHNWSADPSLPPEWSEPYGFIPLVLTRHLDVGLDWGWSELHAGLAKFREVDDQASALGDQVRKIVNSGWLFAGVKAPSVKGPGENTTPQRSRGEAGRQETPVLYSESADAKAHALVAPLPIGEVAERIKDQIAEIERDYPELQMDIWTAGGDTSGRALRVARQRVTSKMQMRRANYDDSLRRAQQMAIAIGGFRGYEGYRGFSLDSYASGKLDHQIGARPVFEADPLDDIDYDSAFWAAAKAAEDAGMPIELYLERKGWSAADIAKITAAKAERQAQAVQAARATTQPATAPVTGGDPNAEPTNA